MKSFRLMLFLLPFVLLTACSDDVVNPPVDNTDTEKPTIQITNPVNDQEISGDQLQVTMTANDNHKVVKIEVFLSTTPFPVATITAEPWETVLDVSGLDPGVYSVSAKAFDSTGNESNRSTISFMKVAAGGFSFSFIDGAEYTYDRWDLDENNMPVETTKRPYVTRIETGDGALVGGQTDWYRMISTDDYIGRTDTLIVRTDAQNNVRVYGLANYIVNNFAKRLVDNGLLPEMPILPDPAWTYLAQINDANGDPLEPGVQWSITQGSGIELSFGLLTATITMEATYLENGEMFTIQGKDIHSWKMGIIVNISILGQDNEIPVYIWFSDDPSAQLQLIQESGAITLGPLTETVEGDKQTLVSWTE